MAQQILTPQPFRPFQDAEPGNIRDSEPLLISVLNKEKNVVIVNNNTKEVCDDNIEQAVTRVADALDISDLISKFDDQDIDGTHEAIGDNDNGENELADIIAEHANEDHGNVYQQLFGSCMYCSKHKRVQRYDQLKRGDSIRFSRATGLYYHHAIVKEVEKGSNKSCCILTLIHLQKTGMPLRTRVIKEQKTYDLREEIVEREIYESNPFSPNEIIQRAEEYVVQDTTSHIYNLHGKNCEHISNEIAQGVTISHQVRAKEKSGIDWIVNTLYEIGAKILQLPGIALVTSIWSLTEIIQKIKQLEKCFREKRVCIRCYDKEYKQQKISLVLALINFAVSFISHFNWTTLTLNLIINIAFPFCAPLVNNYIMPLIQPAFLILKQPHSMQNIPRTGDIITFYYHNLPHEGVVSNVQGSDLKRFKATIIHFPWPGLLKTYTVTEETIYFNETDEVSVLKFEGKHYLSDSDVVKKAKNQLGKQNHSHFTYRSSHLSRYCKTGSKNLEALPTVPVRSMSGLSPGDVIRFKYHFLPHEAVLVKISEARSIRINVIHYNYAGMVGTREVVNEEMTFNLLHENMRIHDYANVEVYEPEEVVRRAKSKVGEKSFNMFTNRSSHFTKWCKIKQKN